jgi:hypothetical protein
VASGIRVKGDVQSEGFNNITVKKGSRVVGSAQLENGGAGRLLDSTVNGDVQYSILANLQANQNTGGLVIRNNTISENLQCRANNPRPTGGGNTAGEKEDQCARL